MDSKVDVKNEMQDTKDTVKKEVLQSAAKCTLPTSSSETDLDTKAAIAKMEMGADGLLLPAPQVG